MNTLYQRTTEKLDIAGNSLGWETVPVLFPDTFFLYSGLQFNWNDNTVTRNGKTYYLDKLIVSQGMDIPKINEWQSHYGNDIKYTYYTGDESEAEKNPTGNTNNIRQAIYLSSGIVKYILEFEYNDEDKIIRQSSKAPADTVASGGEQQDEEQLENDTEQDLNDLKFAIGKELIVTTQNTLLIRTNLRCIMVTRRRTKNPLLTDGLQTEENTGKIVVRLTSQNYDLECIAYSEQYEVLYQSGRIEPTYGTATSVNILNNNATPIAYVAINLHYNDAESEINETTINQSNLGLSVAFVDSVNLLINNADGSEPIIRKYFSGDTVQFSDIPTPTRQGYEFDGWFINNNQISDNFIITENATIEARWTKLYTITLINDGVSQSTSYREGTEITLDSPTKVEHTFLGWYAEGNSSAYPTTFNISEDLTLTAQFRLNQYTLTLVVDGIVGTPQTYDYGTSVELTTPEKQNYTFVGWFTDGSDTAVVSPLIITGNTILTAQFEINKHTLTLINGENQDVETYDYGTEITLPTPEKENYTFLGWFAENAETATTSPLTITENTTLTARYEIIQYTVTLVNVDGRGLNNEDTITCDSGYSLPESEVRAKVDETLTTFVGCYTDSEYTNAVTFPYTVSGDITLYCKFEEIGG